MQNNARIAQVILEVDLIKDADNPHPLHSKGVVLEAVERKLAAT
jgi:hypothetical protein